MTLSKDEQGRLDEIESCTRSTDPVFVASLDLQAAQRRRMQRVLLVQCGFWIGPLILIIGAGAANGMISIGTFVGCYGFIIIVCATVTALRDRSRR